MSGFSDAIVGGIGNLIRNFIRSPNYVPGVSGWTINKDGTAEFQNIIARGNIAADALIVPSDAPQIGQPFIVADDVNGFRVFDGAVETFVVNPFAGGTGGMPRARRLSSLDGLTRVELLGEASLIPDLSADGLQVIIGPDGIRAIPDGSIAHGHTEFLFSTGQSGRYYTQEYDVTNAQVVPTATPTAITNLTSAHDNSDYTVGGMNGGTGVWTCPEDGYYGFTFTCGFTTWAAGSRLLLEILNGTTGRDLGFTETAPGGALTTVNTLSVERVWVTKNDTVTFIVQQVTGANRTVQTGGPKQGRITIGRKL